MDKKAAAIMEVAIAFVIIAVIVIIMFYLINSNNKLLNKGTECASRGGTCQEECVGNEVSYGGCKEKEVCCIIAGG